MAEGEAAAIALGACGAVMLGDAVFVGVGLLVWVAVWVALGASLLGGPPALALTMKKATKPTTIAPISVKTIVLDVISLLRYLI